MWVLALFSIYATGGYLLVNRFNAWRDWQLWSPATALDIQIPVIPAMILIYLSFYLYHPLPVLLPLRFKINLHQVLLAYQAVLLVSLLAFLIFLVSPAEVALRDELPSSILAGEGFWGMLFKGLHGVDSTWNAWPSLHIAQSILIVLYVIWSINRANLNPHHLRWVKCLLWGAWVLLCLSTLVTKQHYVWDILSGFLLGLGVWFWWLKPGLRQLAEETKLKSSSVESPAES